MMGTQACCLCGQRTSMSGASELSGVQLRWPHRLQVCVPSKPALHLLAISDPTDNKRVLPPGEERSRESNSDKADITSGRITTDGRTRRMIANASSALFAFPPLITYAAIAAALRE